MSTTLCEHFRPLLAAIHERGVEVVAIDSPYGGNKRWWRSSCTFDEAALRARLSLAESLKYVEYDGRASGADATWSCDEHGVVLIGPHPRYADDETPCVA